MPQPSPSLESSTHDYTPTVTPDCRRVYFLRELRLDVGSQWSVEMAER
jgi:hypothetical protein